LKLRPYQQTAVDWTFEYLNSMKGNPCICLPTGAGKSLVLAEIINRVGKDKSVLLLSHRKEILEQNYDKIKTLMPLAPVSIYSASLGKKHINRITIAQVQSFAKKAPNMFFEYDYVIIDEVHLLPKSGEGQYRTILKANSKARIIGLTATPIRLDSGSIVGKDNILTHFSYEANINDLIADGYLSPLIGKSSVVQADLSNVKKQGREYILSQAMMAINQDALTMGAVKECLKFGEDRKHWIVFCSGVEHAENVGKCLEREGISNYVITGDTIAMLREKYINEFKAGKVRALINCDVLTTGFDAPCVDLIVLLRATMSTALYCLDLETEILTSHGWKNYQDIKEGDCALGFNEDISNGCWSSVRAVIVRDMEESESWIEYNAPRANFRVTDQHNVIFKTDTRNGWSEWKKDTAEKLHAVKAGALMPTAVTLNKSGIPLTDSEIYLIGIIMTDGSITSTQVTIYQSERHPEILQRIEEMLIRSNIHYVKTEMKHYEGNYINGHEITQRFRRWRFSVPINGKDGKSGIRYLFPYLEKDLAPSLFDMSKNQLKGLILALWDGDGSKVSKCPSTDWTPRSWQICSARKEFLNRLQALCAMNGMTSNVRYEHGQRKTPIGMISITDKDWRSVGGSGKRPQILKTPSTKEKVWCVETDCGNIVTRRKGKVTVMGNCQMLGRGMRIAPGKTNTLVLDFAGNLEKHGPIDKITYTTHKSESTGEGQAPGKICPNCRSLCHTAVKDCPDCGFVFPERLINHDVVASSASPLSVGAEFLASINKPEKFLVDSIDFKVVKSNKDGTEMVSIVYWTKYGKDRVSELLLFNHQGFAKEKSESWWRKNTLGVSSGIPIPTNVDQAFCRVEYEMAWPEFLWIKRTTGKYWEILGRKNTELTIRKKKLELEEELC
jgi:superfamily II DNA or RNA helicase